MSQRKLRPLVPRYNYLATLANRSLAQRRPLKLSH
jgi:hypothetical protein